LGAFGSRSAPVSDFSAGGAGWFIDRQSGLSGDGAWPAASQSHRAV